MTRDGPSLTVPALRAAAASLALAAVLGATACTATSEPTPTVTPAAEALVVGPGEKPPTVFGGDCAAVLTEAQVAEVTGQPLEPSPAEEQYRVIAENMGAAVCQWYTQGLGNLVVSVIPRAGLDGTTPSPSGLGYYFLDECDWFCGWLSESEDLVIAGHFDLFSGGADDRAAVDAVGAAVGAAVRSNLGARSDPSWTRDPVGWWDGIDCAVLSTLLDGATGIAVPLGGGTDGPYADPPPVWLAIGDEASRASWCWEPPDRMSGLGFTSMAGAAWALLEPGMSAVDAGVEGWTSARSTSTTYGDYLLVSDGTNAARIDAAQHSIDDVVAALPHIVAALASATG